MEDLNTTEHTEVLIIFLVSLEWQRKKVGVENAKFMISNSAPQHGQVHPNITQTSAFTAWEAEHKYQILSHWKREWSLQEILLYVDKFYLREHKRTLKVQSWWISSEPYPRQFPLPSQSSLLLWGQALTWWKPREWCWGRGLAPSPPRATSDPQWRCDHPPQRTSAGAGTWWSARLPWREGREQSHYQPLDAT